MVYNPKLIEKKWQDYWYGHNTFKVTQDSSKPKFYSLVMIPYPSASGLHVGHPLSYTAGDIVSRYYKMKGYNVLFPMGWDAFGLPAEQHAIDTKESPLAVTRRAINNFKRQLKALGFSFDWQREISTSDPDFYKWTQKIFTILHKKGLAYQAEVMVNWCPALKTVLANEEVTDGKSERGGHPVYRVPMTQWMLKITAYAEELLDDLESLDWPDSTKDIQRNWIGKSLGSNVRFKVDMPSMDAIEVFTTRVDTLYGVTFLTLAPEHPLALKISKDECFEDVQSYLEAASRKSELERTELSKTKSGVFTGTYAIHPVTGKKLPIWISDYVLGNYGYGAVMGVPGHDARDKEFAEKYGLEILSVLKTTESGAEILKNSQEFNGLDSSQGKAKITELLKSRGLGDYMVSYKLRDWVFSRQRYWGEPIPVMKDKNGQFLRTLNADELPLTLPEITSYEPTQDGKSPLSAISSWTQVESSDGSIEFRETDTMPGSAGSSWYFLRYVDPRNTASLADFEKLKYWMPVDLYIGGQEHAVGHLLYSRFWTKVLFDEGLCPVKEPFKKLVHQGLLCKDGQKMSKSKGNGISPDDVVDEFGADSLRVYEMFMGPLTQNKEWDSNNLAGIHRFLSRFERLYLDESNKCLLEKKGSVSNLVLKTLHKTIKKVGEDIEKLSFNTAISQLMILLNTIQDERCKDYKVLKDFLILLSPFAPHLCEELYSLCCQTFSESYKSIYFETWPVFEDKFTKDDTVTIGVQVNGKKRGEITFQKGSSKDDVISLAHNQDNLKPYICDKDVLKVIYVKDRILNFVVK